MIGIIGALAPEIEKINELFSDKKTENVGGMSFTVGKVGKNSVVTCVCGMGKVFAAACAQEMISHYSVSLVINVGAAGSLSPDFHIGDIAIAEKSVQHDMDNSPLGYRKGEIAELLKIYFDCDEKAYKLLIACAQELNIQSGKATIATGDVFVDSTELKHRIRDAFSADIAEMEGAAIGQVCSFRNIPYCIVRAVSDEADNTAPADFPSFLSKVIVDASRLIGLFLERYGD